MLGRMFWIGAGIGLGLWGRKKALETTEKYVPEEVVHNVSSSLREGLKSFLNDVSEAQVEAKAAMHKREAQIRREVGEVVDSGDSAQHETDPTTKITNKTSVK